MGVGLWCFDDPAVVDDLSCDAIVLQLFVPSSTFGEVIEWTDRDVWAVGVLEELMGRNAECHELLGELSWGLASERNIEVVSSRAMTWSLELEVACSAREGGVAE